MNDTKIKCPNQWCNNFDDPEVIEALGECRSCDHIRSDHDCHASPDDGCQWEGHSKGGESP